MEVLTGVDRDQIEALLARDEFFWLDLEAPSDAELDTAGELLGLHELALEDTREFDQRPKLDHYPDRVLLVYWTAHVTPNQLGIELVEVHLHISGGFLFTVRRAHLPRAGRAPRRAVARGVSRRRTTSSTACSTR